MGIVIPANTAIQLVGSGAGSRKSYSLYSRFSICQIFVWVGRSIGLCSSTEINQWTPQGICYSGSQRLHPG